MTVGVREKIRKNCKGVALPTVLIVTAVLIIIGAALADIVLAQYKNVRSQENEVFTYIAAESALERSMAKIYDLCNDPNITDGITYTGNIEEFAKYVIKYNISDRMLLSSAATYTDIDVLPNSSEKANARISLKYCDASVLNNEMTISIGITAEANLSHGLFSSNGRKAFAVKKYKVTLILPFKLKEAIVTIGDLMADNGVIANIVGDVNVYGTSPYYTSKYGINPYDIRQPEQYYYGGIFAKNNSNITITGNAITRSFIRTGMDYDEIATPPVSPDNSNIFVKGDAIAQCLQIFGKTDKIVVYGNAYTFDDLEIDGENSVIAVNGNYLGLSTGGGFHDESSAIVNAAPVQHSNSIDSLKSRIVVNGAVLIGGETININDTTGVEEYKMENASTAWDSSTDMPAYKNFVKNPVDTDPTDTYMRDLKAKTGLYGASNIYGFLNYIQLWPIQPSVRLTVDVGEDGVPTKSYDLVETPISDWLLKIDADIPNTSGSAFNYLPEMGTLAIPLHQKIQGSCAFVIAANYNMYFNAKYMAIAPDEDEANSGILRITPALAEGLSTDLLPLSSVDRLAASWTAYWSEAISALGYSAYLNKINDKLTEIKNALLVNNVNKLLTRDYDRDAGKILDTPKPSPDFTATQPTNIFLYLQEALNSKYPSGPLNPDPTHVFKYDIDAFNLPNVIHDISDKVPVISDADMATSDYYLVINNDPNRTLSVTSNFKGIIFSMGQVVIGKGANIYGSIIAAGRGYDPINIVGGSAAGYYSTASVDVSRAPKVVDDPTGSNLDKLNDGSYAAVKFDGNIGTGNDPTIVFPGRYTLLNGFHGNLDSIF